MNFLSKKTSHHDAEHDSKPKEKSSDLLTHPSYEELMQQLGEAEQKANQYWERILRMQAESENAQRRNERDVANAHKYGLEKFAFELLPIVDSLELCIVSVPKDLEKAADSIVDGVKLTLKMFYTAMEKFGIQQVNPINQPFNPEFEQAISMQVDTTVAPGTVISVLQKGYTLNNRLLRPALVTVAKGENE